MVFWISWQSFFNTITQNLRRIFWVFVRVKKSNTWIPIALPIETRWLFFRACFNLYPDPWGFMIQFDAFFFLDGLVQPPTINEAMLFEVWGSYRRKKSFFLPWSHVHWSTQKKQRAWIFCPCVCMDTSMWCGALVDFVEFNMLFGFQYSSLNVSCQP